MIEDGRLHPDDLAVGRIGWGAAVFGAVTMVALSTAHDGSVAMATGFVLVLLFSLLRLSDCGGRRDWSLLVGASYLLAVTGGEHDHLGVVLRGAAILPFTIASVLLSLPGPVDHRRAQETR